MMQATDPEIVVLCEVFEGLEQSWKKLPRGYVFASIDDQVVGYKPGKSKKIEFVKKYLVLHKTGQNIQCAFVESGAPRPGLSIHIDEKYFILAIHAPSAGPKTVKPQTQAIESSILYGGLLHGMPPLVVFGDFNVNAKYAERVQKVLQELGSLGPMYTPAIPKEPTHGSNILDWALVLKGKGVEVTNLPKLAGDAVDMELDSDGEEGYRPEINMSSKSDHQGILIKIT